jgi:hypothetical protein
VKGLTGMESIVGRDTSRECEQTLTSFHAANERGLNLLAREGDETSEAVAQAGREALYRHAEAVRKHAARLAKFGR